MTTTDPRLPRPATILDVARVAGVSRQTVTRSLNGLPDVSAATRERVVQAARDLNYRPNRAAQGLVRGRQVTVGLVLDDLRNPYYPEVASEFSRAATARGWGVLLCDLGHDASVAREHLSSMVPRVDVLVSLMPLGELRELVAGVPSVEVDTDPDGGAQGVIEIETRSAVRSALDHLRATGRSRVAMIDSGVEGSGRALAYREYLAEHGMAWSPASEIRVEQTHAGGVRAAGELLRAFPEADALLAFNDVLAIGALKGLARLGVAVPDDVAVVGMDGLDLGALVTPELTTLSIDKAELAGVAVEVVAEMLAGGEPPRRRVARTLLLRESA